MNLADCVSVSQRFQRAIRLDMDLDDPRSLDGYVCPKSSADVLLSLARHVTHSRQTAFTWTGPYGTGKSSLALALGALLGGDAALRAKSASIIGKGVAGDLLKALPLMPMGWRVLPIIGQQASPAEVFGDAIARCEFGTKGQGRQWTDDRVLSILRTVTNADPQNYGGLLILLDEMGKILEGAARDAYDIFLFQQLAEIAVRSNGRLVFVGLLHRSFDEYARGLTRDLRDEWAKVQGRFVDSVVSTIGDEQLDLLARAIHSDKVAHHPTVACQTVADLVRRGRPSAPPNLALTLERCLPLHPIVACLLGPVSRRRFGQNQRSLFGFLNSAEPFGFQDFLRDAQEGDLFGPERLWQYLSTNLEPAILASPDGHRWSVSVEAIERCKVLGGSPLDLQLLKTVALIDLFRERSGLEATTDLLATCLRDRKAQAVVADSLKRLSAWSLVLYRKHLGAYSVYAGSDFDIDAAVAEIVNPQLEVNLTQLRDVAGLQPILAKRHYHETGALRWFDVDFIPVAQVAERARGDNKRTGAIGHFVLAIPTAGETRTTAESLCQAASSAADRKSIVGLSGASWQVVALAKEFLAMSRIADERPELNGDAVARREVQARLADLRARLERDLQKMIESAEWWVAGGPPKHLSLAELSALASDLADAIFPDSPKLTNELLNREQPSSNAVAAMKDLLKQMVLHEGRERVGIDGYPAEGGLFDSLLLQSKLYRPVAQGWRFSAPDEGADPCRLLPAWRAVESFLKERADRPVSLSELAGLWGAPPFGIKRGLLAVLAVTFFLSRRERLAVYREGIFQARLTDVDIDYLVSDPSSVQLRWVDLSGYSRHILDGLADVLREFHPEASASKLTPIEVARGLVALYADLKPWTKRTARLSPHALRLRGLFRQAADPNKLLFDDIPGLARNAVGTADSESVERTIGWIRDGLRELIQAYTVMVTRLMEGFLTELRVPDASGPALTELRARAENIRQLTGDFRLNAFISRLAQFSGSESDIEGIASLAANKPPRDWVDADLDQAAMELADIAQKFIRTEAFARVRGRPDKRLAMAVVVGINGRPTPISGEFDVMDSDRDAIQRVIARVRGVLATDGNPSREVILAALAEISARYLAPEEGNPTSGRDTEAPSS